MLIEILQFLIKTYILRIYQRNFRQSKYPIPQSITDLAENLTHLIREVLCVISAQLAQYWLQTGNFFSNIWIHECDITRRCFENPLIWRYLRAINTFVTDYEKRVKAIMSGLSGDIRVTIAQNNPSVGAIISSN